MKRDLKWFLVGALAMLLIGASFYDGPYPLLTREAFNTAQFSFVNDTNVSIKSGVTLTNADIRWQSGAFATTLNGDGAGGARFTSTDLGGDVFTIDNAGNVDLPFSVRIGVATANTVALFGPSKFIQSQANGTGALTNNGSGTFGWFPNYITASSLDGYGFIFGATNYGSTIGRGSNFVMAIGTNLTMAATNQSAAGGTNFVKLDTVQGITTASQPVFAGGTFNGTVISGQHEPLADISYDLGTTDKRWLNGWIKSLHVDEVNGGWVASTAITNTGSFTNGGSANFADAVTNWSTLLNKGAVANESTVTNTGAINTAGVETNWTDVYMKANATIAANTANTLPYAVPDMALGLTNSSGGTRYLTFMPDFTRRKWSMFMTYGSGAIFFLEAAAANSGTLSYESPTTNSWWCTLFTTASGANSDSGPNSAGTATWFPGKNIDWNWLGKLGRLGTNQVRHWIGLTSTTPANMNSTDSPTTRHVAAVRASPTTNQAADVNWTFVTCDGSACTATPSIVALSTNITHLRIVEDYANARWLLFINGSIAATNSANLPTAAMGSVSSCRNLVGVTQYIGVYDYWCSDADKNALKEYP